MPPNSSVARRDESLRNRACLVCECGVSTQRKNEDEKEKSEKPREVKVSFDFVLAIFPRFSIRSTRRISSLSNDGRRWNRVESRVEGRRGWGATESAIHRSSRVLATLACHSRAATGETSSGLEIGERAWVDTRRQPVAQDHAAS